MRHFSWVGNLKLVVSKDRNMLLDNFLNFMISKILVFLDFWGGGFLDTCESWVGMWLRNQVLLSRKEILSISFTDLAFNLESVGCSFFTACYSKHHSGLTASALSILQADQQGIYMRTCQAQRKMKEDSRKNQTYKHTHMHTYSCIPAYTPVSAYI